MEAKVIEITKCNENSVVWKGLKKSRANEESLIANAVGQVHIPTGDPGSHFTDR